MCWVRLSAPLIGRLVQLTIMQGEKTAPPGAATSARRLAFTQAYQKHADYFLGFFCRKTGNASDAEELSQELWASVYQAFAQHQFTHVRLLQRRANQVMQDFARKRKVREGMTYTDKVEELAATDGFREPGNESEERALLARFWEQFPGVNLTEDQKTVFIMHARYGYKMREIADRYTLPISTIHDWITKVKRECAASLSRKGNL